jgi:acyl-CoA thioesterase-1
VEFLTFSVPHFLRMKNLNVFVPFLLAGLCSLIACSTSKKMPADSPPGALYTDSLLWKSALVERDLENPSFAFVERAANLPDVLLMGNSISIGYTPYVREALAGKANVYRLPENGRDVPKALKELPKWLAGDGWEVIHFNWGLHDLKYLKDGKLDMEGEQNISPERYRELLNQLVLELRKTKAQLIWATTSYIPEGSQGRVRGDEVRYNEIAAEVMAQYPDILIDDQYSLTAAHLQEQQPRNVHFLPEGMKRQGEQVAAKIEAAL